MEERLQDQRNREARAERARQEMELRMQAASKKRSKCEFFSPPEIALPSWELTFDYFSQQSTASNLSSYFPLSLSLSQFTVALVCPIPHPRRCLLRLSFRFFFSPLTLSTFVSVSVFIFAVRILMSIQSSLLQTFSSSSLRNVAVEAQMSEIFDFTSWEVRSDFLLQLNFNLAGYRAPVTDLLISIM